MSADVSLPSRHQLIPTLPTGASLAMELIEPRRDTFTIRAQVPVKQTQADYDLGTRGSFV